MLLLKLSKLKFEAQEMDLIGWKVGNSEIRTDPDKIAGLWGGPCVLKNLKQQHSNLGVTGNHRGFIKGYAKIARPLIKIP